MPDDQEPEQETPFNMAMIYYINLNKLIEGKDKAYMDNNLQLWYKGLDRIFNKVCFKLSDQERETTDKLFITAKAQFKEDINQVSVTLREIDFSLVYFMNKYKMIFPKIDGLRGLDKLYKRYGLKDKPEVSNGEQ